MADVGRQVFRFFREHGYSPAASAGIVGNARQESSLNPAAPGGGLIQGQGGRTSSGTLQQQLRGILGELQGPERGTAAALKRAKGPREAARIFSQRFERPGEPRLSNRERYAVEALGRYKGENPVIEGATMARQIAPHLEAEPQQTALAPIIQALTQPQQGPQIAGTPLQRPVTSGGPPPAAAGPKVPSPLTPALASEPNKIAELLAKVAPQALAPEQGPAATPQPAGAPKQQGGAPAATGYPLGKHGKVIGLPYQGTHTLGNWESDNAVDIAVPKGTPVYALADGTIGSQIGSLGSGSSRFAGERLHLVTKGNEFYYAHLSKLAVKAGQRVRAGQLLGYSGEANGVQHLHLGEKHGSPVGLTKR